MTKGNIMFTFSSYLWYNKQRILKNGEASLYLQVVIERKHKQFELKLSWPIEKINLVKNQLLPRYKNDTEVFDYNLIIKCALAKHTEIQLTYRLRKENLDLEKFSREVKTFDNKECFITYFEAEADRRYRKKEIELKTYQNAKAVLLQVMAFDNLSLFKSINKAWLQDFRLYLENATYGSKNKRYEPGTIWDRLKTTIGYLRLASNEPMIYVDEKVFEFKNPKPQTTTTYLNREELRRLIILQEGDLSDVKMRVLKAFLFACFTGLRISDIYKVNNKWEVQENFLDFIPHKNRKKGHKIRIPLLPIARTFIKSYGLKFFDLPNQVQFNETLKQLADKAEINKVLTAHVARHTFGYLYMTSIGNILGLKELLGHKKVETTERYAHIDDDYKYESALAIEKGFGDLIMRIAK